jgi:hypothetical protein
MSVVLPVERITPETLQAVQVAMGDNGQIAGVIAALIAELTQIGYQTESLTGPEYIGGWRIKLTYAGEVDQFAYPNDWILVTDAAYTDTDGWVLQDTSRAYIYGISAGLPGTAVDFVNTYTVNTDMVWAATTTPPIATALDGLQATVAFPQPVSPNGPFTYTLAGPGIPGEFSDPATDGTVTVTAAGLSEGAECLWSVAVATQYAGVGATSQPSNTVTAATTVPVPPPTEVP